MDYLTLKSLHVAGACLFVGNNLVTPFWKFLADRTRQPVVVAHAQRLVTLTDFVFTGGGIALLLGSGHGMIALNPALWEQTCLRLGYAAFALSGLLWLAVLLPVQIRQARLARGFATGGPIPAEYWRLTRRWNAVGAVASLLPLGTLWLMVSRR